MSELVYEPREFRNHLMFFGFLRKNADLSFMSRPMVR